MTPLELHRSLRAAEVATQERVGSPMNWALIALMARRLTQKKPVSETPTG
ncbi:hypothetical protein ITI46_07835 [Streptomyces oryzae]|uniref:Uncharacterized protein n=1 Tax=Streptomyces oryzae TaxID=1434886 RepID=A0ABS3X890_9ACTN|nr:hypothetical protein [Streptomyces oryzae]MBO8191600.1 hypothetical protein [Streptomyces oryzae]